MQYRVVAAVCFLAFLVIALYVATVDKKTAVDLIEAVEGLAEQQDEGQVLSVDKPHETSATIKQKKREFFNFLIVHVLAENMELLQQRQQLVSLQKSFTLHNVLSIDEQHTFDGLLHRYRLSSSKQSMPALFDELMIRVDIIPTSLALSQSANESAWGTSRFAKEGNNYFGQWCFRKGCGLVPSLRPEGEIYEVAQFDNVRASVSSYFRNINTHAAYKQLRGIRAQLRHENKTIKGELLADGLVSYSERGEEYVNELKAMIRVNALAKWDQQLSNAATDYARQGESTGVRASENVLLR